MNKKLPRGIFLPTELFESAFKIKIVAPIKPRKIPVVLEKLSFFLNKKKDKITTKIGVIIINIELLIGVEKSSPVMKAAMLKPIPKRPHFRIVNLSFFSIFLLFLNKLIIQNKIVAPSTLNNTRPREPI